MRCNSGKHLHIIIILALAGLLASCGASKMAPPEEKPADAVSAATEAPTALLTVDEWIKAYPVEAGMTDMSRKMSPSPTGYGGSVNFQRVKLSPEIAVNFKGSAFGKDYAEDRGHSYAWEDLVASKRVTEKTPAACLSCKTRDIASIFSEQGWAYANKPLSSFTSAEHPGIDCLTCHNPETQKLRAIQPGFIEAAGRVGIDLAGASKNDMESLVCAQCHSEYYFEPVSSKVVFPWDKGLGAKEAWEYYSDKPAGFDGDFTQTDSGTRLLKAQHPDYEEYAGGVHGQAGVSCAACHMPTVEIEGKEARNHTITSPLLTVEASCVQCHANKSTEWLTAQVKYRQDTVFAAQSRAGAAVANAHNAIAEAAKRKPNAPELSAARELVRKAQWFWDYTASANSMGFHNPVGALDNLSIALDLAKDATIAAVAIK